MKAYVDKDNPGIVRFTDGADSMDGVLAGTRAKKIVIALNSHDALVEVVQRALEWHRGNKWRFSKKKVERDAWKRECKQIEDALALVRGEV